MNEFNHVSWPGWEVVRKIGSGSFGSVYEIKRDVFGEIEHAALKVITIPQSHSDIEELLLEGYDEPSITERFRGYLQDIAKEYSLMAKMKGHTNIVYCDDIRYVEHKDSIGWDIYIKMELLTPMMNTLTEHISEKTVIRVGMDICNALVLCRRQNIVHRDIKPQNIFVSDDGNYKLGDFGIAKTAEKTTGGTKIGTYKYMAPEVYNNQPYGAAADIYSLGIVLYWMLNARRTPFLPLPPQVPTAKIEEEARRLRFIGTPLPLPANGSPALQAIVIKACAYNAADRYSTPDEMLADLRALAYGNQASVLAAKPTPPADNIPTASHSVLTPAPSLEMDGPVPDIELLDIYEPTIAAIHQQPPVKDPVPTLKPAAIAQPLIDPAPASAVKSSPAPSTPKPPVKTPPVQTPPVKTPPVQTPPVKTPPVKTPPVQTPPVKTPPVQTPPVKTPPVKTTPASGVNPPKSPSAMARNKWVAVFLCLFSGFLGIHCFYEKKYTKGIVYLFTFGMLYVGWITDLVRLFAKPSPYYTPDPNSFF